MSNLSHSDILAPSDIMQVITSSVCASLLGFFFLTVDLFDVPRSVRAVWVISTLVFVLSALYAAALVAVFLHALVVSLKIIYDPYRREQEANAMVGHFSMSTYIKEYITQAIGAPIMVWSILMRRGYAIAIATIIVLLFPAGGVHMAYALSAPSIVDYYNQATPIAVFKCDVSRIFSASTTPFTMSFQPCYKTPVNLFGSSAKVSTGPGISMFDPPPPVSVVSSICYPSPNCADRDLTVGILTKTDGQVNVGVLGLDRQTFYSLVNSPLIVRCGVITFGAIGHSTDDTGSVSVVVSVIHTSLNTTSMLKCLMTLEMHLYDPSSTPAPYAPRSSLYRGVPLAFFPFIHYPILPSLTVQASEGCRYLPRSIGVYPDMHMHGFVEVCTPDLHWFRDYDLDLIAPFVSYEFYFSLISNSSGCALNPSLSHDFIRHSIVDHDNWLAIAVSTYVSRVRTIIRHMDRRNAATFDYLPRLISQFGVVGPAIDGFIIVSHFPSSVSSVMTPSGIVHSPVVCRDRTVVGPFEPLKSILNFQYGSKFCHLDTAFGGVMCLSRPTIVYLCTYGYPPMRYSHLPTPRSLRSTVTISYDSVNVNASAPPLFNDSLSPSPHPDSSPSPSIVDSIFDRSIPNASNSISNSSSQAVPTVDLFSIMANAVKTLFFWAFSTPFNWFVRVVWPYFPSISFYSLCSRFFAWLLSLSWYLLPGYFWESLVTNVNSISHCFSGWFSLCYHLWTPPPTGFYPMNTITFALSCIFSMFCASMYIMLYYRTVTVSLPYFSGFTNRPLYSLWLFVTVSIGLLAISLRWEDYFIFFIIGSFSGIRYATTAEDKYDHCFRAPLAIPSSLFWCVRFTIQFIYRMFKQLVRRVRLAIYVFAFMVIYFIGRIGPYWFLDTGLKFTKSKTIVPWLWTILAVISSACREACYSIAFNTIPTMYWASIATHLLTGSVLSVSTTIIYGVIMFFLSSNILWDIGVSTSIPVILKASGHVSKIFMFSRVPHSIAINSLLIWVLTQLIYIGVTQFRIAVYSTLMRGYTFFNVARVYPHYSSWRLKLAKFFVPNPKFKNVYWLTATTGAGKTTAEVYSRFVVDDDLTAGLGFNVIDVDGCTKNMPDRAAGLAEARMAASSTTGLTGFLKEWVPIAKKYVHEELDSIRKDPVRRSKSTLVVVHVPDEGSQIGLPLCNFLGHIQLTEAEMGEIIQSRAAISRPDVTRAFIVSDNAANFRVPKIDWPDVQTFLAPIKGIKDLPLAVFPDISHTTVYVNVEAKQLDPTSSEHTVSSSLGAIPLFAIVKQQSLLLRHGLTYVQAEYFGDVKASILEFSRHRAYYDDIPIKKDGTVDRVRCNIKPLHCVVYRLELPARHGARGIARPIAMRNALMAAGSVEAAARIVEQSLGGVAQQPSPAASPLAMFQPSQQPQVVSQSMTPVSQPVAAQPPSQFTGLYSSQIASQSVPVQPASSEFAERELKAAGSRASVAAPPLAQYQSAPPGSKIIVHGLEWPDDDSIVYKGKNALPPTPPSRVSATSPCPTEVAKVIDVNATHSPASPLEALRRYVPGSLAGKIVAVAKHGDAASRVKHVRQARGWAIQFSDEASKNKFFQSLPDGAIGTEIVATPFTGNYWKPDAERESEVAVAKFKAEMLQEN